MMRYAFKADSLQKHLDHAQWWPPEILRQHQAGLLVQLIRHAKTNVPWYADRLDEGILSADGKLDLDAWRAVPLLTRSEIRRAGSALHSSQLPPEHGRVSQQQTSGSTGEPLVIQTTELTRRVWIANTLRKHSWQGTDLDKKLAVIRRRIDDGADPPDGVTLSTWGTATVGRVPTGPCVVLSVTSTTSQQAEWLAREQPDYLQTFPSVAFELARHVQSRGQSLEKLQQVLTFGEVLEPAVRKACRDAWNAEVVDSYSANEVGHVAVQCASDGPYHVQAEHLLVEVLDSDGNQCGRGQTGRVVVTDFFNYAMPLLRYDIGDYATVGDACSCGRNLPTLRNIVGRQRNMFVLPGGETIWPALNVDPLEVLDGELPIRQFQVAQVSHGQLEARLVSDRPLSEAEQGVIRTMLADATSDDFDVRFTYVDKIPRGPTGKFEDFRCELGRPN